jgi:hypothetical protein
LIFEHDDSKAVLATWEYNTYKFAIMGEDKPGRSGCSFAR